MSLSLGYNPILLIACAIVAGIVSYVVYRRSRPLLTYSRRIPLVLLRFLSLTLILFLLFEPVVRYFSSETKTPTLAVLIDSSRSMEVLEESGQDPASTLKRIPLDNIDGKVRFYSFDGSTRVLGDFMPDSISYRGERTDVNQALQFVREDLGDENLGGVLILSDGLYNTGRNPIYPAERYPKPIHTVVTGDTTQYNDVQIRRTVTNEVAYVETELPIQVGVRSDGYEGRSATVTLSESGAVLGSTTITLAPNQQELNADLYYTPSSPGLKRLTVAVTRFDGELTYENNISNVTVRVLENKIRTVLIAGAASPDITALHQTLLADSDLEMSMFVQQSAGAYYEGNLPEDFDDFDVIVLAGYPGPATSASDAARIVAAISEGKPVIFLLGRQTNLSLLKSQFQEVLPVFPQVVRPGFFEAQLAISSGFVHPVLDIPEIDLAATRNLPPLMMNESRWLASPDARPLASARVQGVVLDDPLLVVRTRSGYRSAALLGADYWRWQSLPADLDELVPFWPRLLSNLMRWVTTQQDDRPVRVRTTRTLYGSGETVQFTGQVYDESLNPVDRAAVTVVVKGTKGDSYPFTLNALGNGRYFLDAGTLPEGTYTYEAQADSDGTPLGTDSGSFAVGTVSVEFQETTADANLLRQVAQRSGGIFMYANESGTFADRLEADQSFEPVQILQEQESELWNIYYFLIAIIFLLTLEWFFRKRFGMV